MNDIIDKQIETIKSIFKGIDPSVTLHITDLEGEKTVSGPFPSFMLLVTGEPSIRALIHVNADATNMVYVFNEFSKELSIEFDGSYAVKDGQLLTGFEAYQEKERNMVAFAEEIVKRNPQLAEKKIYVPNQSIYTGQ